MSKAARDWWTAGQVAVHLGVHRATVARIPRSELPYDTHGGRDVRRYSPDAVRAFAALRSPAPDASLAGLLAEHARRLDGHDIELAGIRERLEDAS